MTSQSILPPFPPDMPTADIATVAYDKLIAGDETQAQAIYDAATGYGFFYLSGHDIDASSMFGLADKVFDLPLNEKLKYDMGTTGHYFGYKSTLSSLYTLQYTNTIISKQHELSVDTSLYTHPSDSTSSTSVIY